MGEFIYSLTQMYKSWKHWPMCKAKQLSRIKPSGHTSSPSWNWKQSPSTKHPENILQALKNFTNFFKHSTTWAPKARAKELQQEAPFLLFCKDWAMERVFKGHGTTRFLCQQHMPPPTPHETTSTSKKKKNQTLKAGRFYLSDFMTSKYIYKKEYASMILSENCTVQSEN